MPGAGFWKDWIVYVYVYVNVDVYVDVGVRDKGWVSAGVKELE